MNDVIACGSSKFRKMVALSSGSQVDKLHLKRSFLRPKSSTVIYRWLFNRLTEIKFNGKAKEESFCCRLTLKLTGMESVYFAACNFKTTDKSGLNLGIFQRVYKNFRME